MKVTNVVVRLNNIDSRVKAIASILFDDCFAVHDIAVVENARNDSLLLVFPNMQRANGMYSDIVHPTNQETRKMIEDAIFSEYERVTKNEEGRRKDKHRC